MGDRFAGAKVFAIEAAPVACLIVAAITVHLPAPLAVALVILCLTVVAGRAWSPAWPAQTGRWSLMVAWACVVSVTCGFLYDTYFWVSVHALPLWLAAVFVWHATRHFRDGLIQNRWKAVAMMCAFSGAVVWIAPAYLNNRPLTFYAGVVISLVLLITCKSWFRLRTWSVQMVNTVVLLLVCLPAADVLVCGVNAHEAVPDPAAKYYSYEVGARHPAKFAYWWYCFWTQWNRVGHEIQTDKKVAAGVPFRLIPNSQATFFQSRISINSKGFRGPEFSEDKGGAYRIVAVGESTTFGLTLTEQDHPWPELLQQMIRERLKPRRPVEVINAGMVSFDIRENLARLPGDILPLKPDLIISYHGINGFNLIEPALHPVTGEPPPSYHPRALHLLADAEFQIRTRIYARRRAAAVPAVPGPPANPLDTAYAGAYRQLIEIARTNGIRLALANYSMAANAGSDPRVIEFYRRVWPQIDLDIKANAEHSAIVAELARQHPQVCLVDTHPNLDGRHEEFIDLIHFSADGERALAENIFAGISNIVAESLSPADAPPRPP